jgi:hypothetical protein
LLRKLLLLLLLFALEKFFLSLKWLRTGKRRFYPRILFTYLKKIQISLQLFISTFKIYGLVVQKNSSRLFHTILFLQLLFILFKFYLDYFKYKFYGKNIVRFLESRNKTYT